MANLTGVPGDRSTSLGWKFAKKTGGAVPSLASAQPIRAMEAGKTSPDTPARLVQLVRRQRYRGPQRLVFVAGVERLSRLCVLMNPILPGAVHLDLAGEMLKKPVSCGPDISGGTQEVNLRVRQLTNRRIRTFIAVPSARNVNNTEDPP